MQSLSFFNLSLNSFIVNLTYTRTQIYCVTRYNVYKTYISPTRLLFFLPNDSTKT